MKSTFFTTLVLLLALTSVNAQSDRNPIEFLEGKWIRKLIKVEPAPDDFAYEDAVTLVEFIPIMDGRGMRQRFHEYLEIVETYSFYDEGASKLYGMTIDANGYVWQTEMAMGENGEFGPENGKPLNDASVRSVTNLTKKNRNEMTFTYTVYKDGELAISAEGFFMRVPRKNDDW